MTRQWIWDFYAFQRSTPFKGTAIDACHRIRDGDAFQRLCTLQRHFPQCGSLNPGCWCFAKDLHPLKALSPIQVHPVKAISLLYILESGITTFTSVWHHSEGIVGNLHQILRDNLSPEKASYISCVTVIFGCGFNYVAWCIQHWLPIQHPSLLHSVSEYHLASCCPETLATLADFLLNGILTRKLFKEPSLQLLYCLNLCHIKGKDIPSQGNDFQFRHGYGWIHPNKQDRRETSYK